MICWVSVTDFGYADLQHNRGHRVPDARGLIVLSTKPSRKNSAAVHRILHQLNNYFWLQNI